MEIIFRLFQGNKKLFVRTLKQLLWYDFWSILKPKDPKDVIFEEPKPKIQNLPKDVIVEEHKPKIIVQENKIFEQSEYCLVNRKNAAIFWNLNFFHNLQTGINFDLKSLKLVKITAMVSKVCTSLPKNQIPFSKFYFNCVKKKKSYLSM